MPHADSDSEPNERTSRLPSTTLRHVAAEAGVSVGTASRVLSGAAGVREATRQRVLEAAERLGYQPHLVARGLAKGLTHAIGVLAPFFFTRGPVLETIRGVQAGASGLDYALVVYNVERPEQAISHLATLGRSTRVDGLVVVTLDGSLAPPAPADLPFAVVCADTAWPGCPQFVPDHEQGAYLAARHLIEHGHGRLALIDRGQDPVSQAPTAARRKGFEGALREAGIEPEPHGIQIVDQTPEAAREAAEALLAAGGPPTAFVCASDQQAVGVMRAVRERGLRVGLDVAVTGYHDAELATHVGLTSVHVPLYETGKAAVEHLIGAIGQGRGSESVSLTLPPYLVTRQSCGCGD